MSVTNGVLVITGTGSGSPVVMTKAPAVDGDITVEFRMRTSAAGPARVFWHAGAEGGFPAERAVKVDFANDGQWHDCAATMTIPETDGNLSGIRIDPTPDKNGRVELDWVRIRKADGKTVIEWDFNDQ